MDPIPQYLSSVSQTLVAGAQEKGKPSETNSPGRTETKESEEAKEGRPKFEPAKLVSALWLLSARELIMLEDGLCHLEEVAE